MLVKIDCRNKDETEAYCHEIEDFEQISEATRHYFIGDNPVMIIELDGTIYSGERADIIDIGEEQIIKKSGTNIYKIRLEV